MLVCSSSHYSVQYFRYFVKSTHFSERLKFIMLEKRYFVLWQIVPGVNNKQCKIVFSKICIWVLYRGFVLMSSQTIVVCQSKQFRGIYMCNSKQYLLYVNTKSARSLLNSSVSRLSFSSRCVHDSQYMALGLLVKRRWTSSTALMPFKVFGLQTVEQYSSNGRTYTLKAFTSECVSLKLYRMNLVPCMDL